MTRTEVIRRHTLIVRITHWINAATLFLLLMSGLQIFNAHPALYWGQTSKFDSPWLSIDSVVESNGRAVGYIQVAGHRAVTTGVLGLSSHAGQIETQAFPAWATLPSAGDLATGRRWHFLMAWIFATNLTLYIISGLVAGHIQRDLLPTRSDMRPATIFHDIVEHLKLNFPEGDHARRYNVLQKLTYLGIFFIILPLAVATGCTMSPAVDAAAPWLLDLFGGRQSARSIHFLVANLIVLFVLVHLAMVVLSGAWNNIRSMITGRYVLRFKDHVHEG